MPSNERLSEFAAVVAAGSISAAARALGLERATLSRRMSGLEADLGVLLFHRSTGHLRLTSAGKELSGRARRIVADADEAWSAVRRMDDVPRGVLRVSTVGDALDELLLNFVADFPEVHIEVIETSRVVDLIAESIDVAVRFGPVRDGNLIVRRIGEIKRIVVASPTYLKQHGCPASPKDLSDHHCIVGFSDGAPAKTWPLREGGRVPVAGRVAHNDLRLPRAAALASIGLALLTTSLARDDIRDGTLIPVLPEVVGDSVAVSLVFPEREYLDPKVRVFVDRAIPVLKSAYGDAQHQD